MSEEANEPVEADKTTPPTEVPPPPTEVPPKPPHQVAPYSLVTLSKSSSDVEYAQPTRKVTVKKKEPMLPPNVSFGKPQSQNQYQGLRSSRADMETEYITPNVPNTKTDSFGSRQKVKYVNARI